MRDDHPEGGAVRRASKPDPARSNSVQKGSVIPAAPDHTKWLLLLLPVLLAAANSSWLYNPPGSIDPWVYFGYFLHLTEFKSSLFPYLYYGSRLPWILPGHLIHRLFDVTAAKYVLHFAFYYAATFSIYGLLKRALGRKNALLGAIVFGTHAAFLRSIGWDYVDGAGITYNLLALACVARATVAGRRWLWLMLAGMASAAMFYTNLFLVVFLPMHVAFYLFLTGTGINGRLFRSILDLLLWFAGGAAVLTIALGAINYRLDGTFWFYAPSIRAFLSYSSQPSPWRINGLAWLRKAYWLAIPVATAVACVAYLIRGALRKTIKWGDYQTFFVIQYLAAAAVMVTWYVAGGIGIQMTYYVSYLLPSMFLAIGCILAVAGDEWTPLAWWSVIGADLIAFAIGVRAYGGPLTQSLKAIGLAPFVAFATVAFLSRTLFPRRWQTIVPALSGLLLLQSAYAEFEYYSQPYRDVSQRVVEGVNAAWPYVQTGNSFFWYDANERYGLEFNGTNATYLWGYSFLSTRFPVIEQTDRLTPGKTIVLLSGSNRALERAKQTLHQRELEGSVMGTHRIDHRGVAYDLTFLRIDLPNLKDLTIDPRSKTAELVVAKSDDAQELPLSAWKATRMERRPEGVLVTTDPAPSAYGSWYVPLFAQRSGRYQFTLRYRVISGGILFGGMTADMSHGLGRALMTSGTGRLQIATYVARLAAGEGVVLLIANYPPTGAAGAATYLIESVRAAASFDDATLAQSDAHETISKRSAQR